MKKVTPPKPARPRGRKPKEAGGLSTRLRELRARAGISQEAIGSQGFVSTPGWIKIENGQRSPSEKLLVGWLVGEKVVAASAKSALLNELCATKYSEHRSPFLASMARDYLAGLPKK